MKSAVFKVFIVFLYSAFIAVHATPTLSLEASVDETLRGGSFQVLAILSDPSSEVVTATFKTRPVTADEGEDYLPVVRSLVFSPGEVLKTIEVDTISDFEQFDEEELMVELSDVEGAILIPQKPLLTILGHEIVLEFDSNHTAASPRGNGEFTFSYKALDLALERYEDADGVYFASPRVEAESSLVIRPHGEMGSRAGDFQVVRLEKQDPDAPMNEKNLKVHYAWGAEKTPQCHMAVQWIPCPWNGIYPGLHSFEKHPQDLTLPGYNFVAKGFEKTSRTSFQKDYYFEKEGMIEDTHIEVRLKARR